MAVSEKLRRKLEKRKEDLAKKGGGDYKTIIFQQGVTRLRILPAGPDEDFAQEVTQFFLTKETGSVVSPATFGEPCAIMEAHQELKSGDEDDQKLAGEFKPTRRYYAPAIKFEDEKGGAVDGGPRLAILPATVYNDLIDLMLDDENGDFTDPREGYDVKIKKEGQGKMGTTYSVLACKPTKLPKEFIKETFDPEEMTRELVPSYDETTKMINAYLNLSPDEGEEEEEAPRKKRPRPSDDMGERPRKKKRPRPSDDEAPRKKRKRPRD